MLHSKFIRVAAIAAATFTAQAAVADEMTLPKTMVWTSYDVGSAGYTEASAIADVLDKTYCPTVRIIPSGTCIGCLRPLQTGRASFGSMGNETHFAGEAMDEFADREWGPQDMRVVLG